MFLYLAGPLTAGDGRTVKENVALAVAIYLRLIAANVCAFCPHLCALVPEAFAIPYEHWLAYDFKIIERCDAVLMLPNWEQSSGARREHEFAQQLDKKIFYDVAEIMI